MRSENVESTARFAKAIAHEALETPHPHGALVYALVGDLGTGKTTFTQSFAQALGMGRLVPSPSFLIMRKYELPSERTLIHIDAYRLASSKELLDLGFENVLKDPRNIVVVEWADNVADILPQDTKWFHFKHGEKENERDIEA